HPTHRDLHSFPTRRSSDLKDRELMRRTPHLLIEGMLLAGLVTGAKQGYIYIRHEYHEEKEVLQEAINEACEQGLLGENILGSGLDRKSTRLNSSHSQISYA